MAFLTDAQVKTKLAANLKVAEADLPDAWDEIVPDANTAGQNEVTQAITNLGYTAAQAATWDRAAEFNRDMALFWCLVNGAGLHGHDPTFIDKLDRRAELKEITAPILIGGEPVDPDDDSGGVGYGEFDTTDDRFTPDMTW